jgi:diacylglycerol O-acyltransferase / wax synthase
MTSADVAFLHRETRTAPQHLGGLIVLDVPSGGFDYDRLVRLLEERISLAPRYRQKVRMVPAHLANPVWVDDPRFDITYHVRRSALPRPGTDAQLLDFAARILSRRLDRNRPLWEMYLVEGLSGGRTAIVTKTHAAMVGEPDGIDLAQVLLDAASAPRRTVEPIWMPGPEPSAIGLLGAAVVGMVRRPLLAGETVRAAARDLHLTAARVTGLAGGLAGGLAATAGAVLRRAPDSPLQARLSEQRRLAVARTRLADYRAVRDAFGGTVNDVVLAVVAGALRGWLLSRSVPLHPGSSVRALVPVGVTDAGDGEGGDAAPGDAEAERVGARFAGEAVAAMPTTGPGGPVTGPTVRPAVRPLLVDLPVGEPDAVLRLARLRYAMAGHHASGRAIDAHTLTELAGFAPPTLHALGARAAGELTRRLFSLVITNVPGPQLPLYAAGARMREMFPVLPLEEGHAASIALASYDGGVFYGVNGDWDALPDVALLADLLGESLAELVDAATASADPPRSRLVGARRPEGDRT